jgi:undecaprenyl-diphosphatase
VIVTRHAGAPTATERALFDLVRSIPGTAGDVSRVVYGTGTLWAVALVFAAAVIGRRPRLAVELLVAGVAARVLARVVRDAVGSSALGLLHTQGPTSGYPAIRVAVVVAVAATAAPFISRTTRRLGWFSAAAVAAAGMGLGTFEPAGVAAGVLLGWGLAAALHLAFGSPGGRPAVSRLVANLEDLGVVAHDVRISDRQTPGMTVMRGADATGPLRIKVFGRDETGAQLLAKVRRAIVYKEAGPRLFMTPLEQVEHEAYVMLLAGARGVRVPDVVVAGNAGEGSAVLVQREIEGRLLGDTEADELDDALLDRLWRQVEALHEASVVHGCLDADHVVVGPEGPAIVGFQAAAASGPGQRAARDVAALLATTGALVGPRRAVAAAVRVLPREAIVPALPLLQPAVLSRRTRQLLGRGRRSRRSLHAVRNRAAGALGTTQPDLVRLRRVKASSILMALGTLVAVAGLLAQVGSPSQLWATLSSAQWSWIALALVLSLASNIAYAEALEGTVPTHVPLWPTFEVQVAMSFANLAVPGVGGIAMQVRYLQRQGVDLPSAVAAGGLLSTVGNYVVGAVVVAVALAVQPGRFSASLVPTQGLAVLALGIFLAAALGAAVIAGIPRIRRAVGPPMHQAAASVWGVLREPRLVARLVGGNVAMMLLAAACLAASLAAFGGTAPFGALLATNIVVGTIASAVPISGGSTAVAAVGLSGALVALGVPHPVAVAAALGDQLAFSWLPAIPGWFACRHLVRHDYL